MRDLIPTFDAWLAAGQRAALCTVVAVHGRAPLPLGASLAVAEDGATSGAVSGGCVEREVIAVAQRVLRGEAPPQRLRFAPDGDELSGNALPCGGGIDVWVQPWGSGALAAQQEAFASAVRAGEPARLRFATGSGEAFTLPVEPVGRMVLIGAGPVAGALCDLAPSLDLRAIVVDPREVIAAHAPIGGASELMLVWPDEALGRLAPLTEADAVIALSHQPSLDDVALRAALGTAAGFIGALGSRTAHADRLDRLRAHGASDAELARISGPVGLDLGGWLPGEVALSIAAELVAARHGRGGGRLSERSGAIHDGLVAAGAGGGDGAATEPAVDSAASARWPDGGPDRPLAAVVLAAGAGRRFGGVKQVATWGGEALVARAVRAAAHGLPPGSEVVVVLGAHERAVRAALPTDHGVRVVVAEDWQEGIGASLRAGLAALAPPEGGPLGAGQPAVLVVLADQPLVDADLVACVAREGSAAIADGAAAARPIVDGTPGHPVLLGPFALTRAADLSGDRGLAPLLTELYVHEIATAGRAAIVDVDRPTDLLPGRITDGAPTMLAPVSGLGRARGQAAGAGVREERDPERSEGAAVAGRRAPARSRGRRWT